MHLRIVLHLLVVSLSVLPLAAEAKADSTYLDTVTGMEFVAVPGGTFLMGDAVDTAAHPIHSVTVKPFWIGRYEVTFAQYAQFCAATRRQLPDDNGWGMGNRPVINVSWQDAVAFTEWLSARSGRKFRLPSEAEWEFAARGGATTPFPWGNELGTNHANCSGCGSPWDNRSTAPVGTFMPNGYGLHDVIGNVYEWCLDMQHDNYQGAPGDGSPWLEGSLRTDRVYRGASYHQPPEQMTVGRRCWGEHESGTTEIGFRVLLEPSK